VYAGAVVIPLVTGGAQQLIKLSETALRMVGSSTREGLEMALRSVFKASDSRITRLLSQSGDALRNPKLLANIDVLDEPSSQLLLQ
jgi:hypothetical protein